MRATKSMHKQDIELFKTAITRIMDQGNASFYSVDGGNYCCYRSPDGAKCVIGQIIPDEIYVSHWDESEGESFSSIFRDHFSVRNLFKGDPEGVKAMGDALQSCHDACTYYSAGIEFREHFYGAMVDRASWNHKHENLQELIEHTKQQLLKHHPEALDEES